MEIVNQMKYNRRNFISTLAAAGASIPFAGSFGAQVFKSGEDAFPVTFFTKPLDEFELEFMAEALAMAGIDGFDLAVRPGGRVNPERAADELPSVVETGRKYGLSAEMMVTSVKEANPETRNLLKTAAACGIKHYRLGYFNYDFQKGIWESLKTIKKGLEPLVALNREVGIQAGYQNHSGTRVGAPVWDVWELIKDFPVEQISSQFDIRHAVTEGAASWILAMRLLGNNIGSLAVKDFTWKVEGGKAQVVSVPLGEGIVDFESFFKTVKELGIVAPISLHVEYPLLDKQEETLPLLKKQEIIAGKLKGDVDFIRRHLKNN